MWKPYEQLISYLYQTGFFSNIRLQKKKFNFDQTDELLYCPSWTENKVHRCLLKKIVNLKSFLQTNGFSVNNCTPALSLLHLIYDYHE